MSASSSINTIQQFDYNKFPLLESNLTGSPHRVGFNFFDKIFFKNKIVGCSELAKKTHVGQLLRRGDNKLNRSVFITPQNDIFILFNTKEDRLIARGGQKKVKLALNVVTGEIVAYKVVRELHAQAERDLIVAEYEFGLSLTGDTLCKPIKGSLRVEEDRIVYLEEYMPCGDLTRFLEEGIDKKALLPLAQQMAGALADLHEQGYLSRDIKPANYFIERFDDGIPVIRLGDFGEAVPIHGISLKKQLPAWTYGFVSPEYLQAADIEQKDQRAQAVVQVTTEQHDSWALGISMLAIFQGHLVDFVKSNSRLEDFLNEKDQNAFVGNLTNESEWIKEPEVKNTLEYVIYKLLIVDPSRRWTPRQAADHLNSLKLDMIQEATSLPRMDSPMSQGDVGLSDPMSTERQDPDTMNIAFNLDDLLEALELLD